MDEKELIARIRNSFEEGLSQSEIIRRLQRKGYKLEYIEEMLKKAKRPRRVLITLSFILVFILICAFFSYFFIFSSFFKNKQELINPLIRDSSAKNMSEIEITSEYVSYLLNEIGAWKLHKNPLTFEKPIINLNISSKKFYSEIDKTIKTSEGSNNEADIEFQTTKEEIIRAISNNSPEESFKESIQDGITKINLLAGEVELYSKGYLSLYNELKSPDF